MGTSDRERKKWVKLMDGLVEIQLFCCTTVTKNDLSVIETCQSGFKDHLIYFMVLLHYRGVP